MSADCPTCHHAVEFHDERGCDMQSGTWATGPTDCDCEWVPKWRWYLPLDCPRCERRRLEYRTNDDGNVVQIKCEKCGFNTAYDSEPSQHREDVEPATSGSQQP